ncbi:MAG: DivIVA domain-containing protein [Acidimicrobiia bacterium]
MELSSRDIEERGFGSSVRGYDRREVDGFLHDVVRAMGTLEEHLAIAERRAGESERNAAEMRTRIDQELQEATEARRAIIEGAKREALAIGASAGNPGEPGAIGDAAERAVAIVAEAEAKGSIRLQEVSNIVDDAHSRAEQTIKTAQEDAAATRAEASVVLDNARRRAREVRAQAETERAAMIADISELKKVADAVRNGSEDLEAFETANVILTSGSEITIDLRDEVTQPAQTIPG